jgi:hypothetical protein
VPLNKIYSRIRKAQQHYFLSGASEIYIQWNVNSLTLLNKSAHPNKSWQNIYLGQTSLCYIFTEQSSSFILEFKLIFPCIHPNTGHWGISDHKNSFRNPPKLWMHLSILVLYSTVCYNKIYQFIFHIKLTNYDTNNNNNSKINFSGQENHSMINISLHTQLTYLTVLPLTD